MTQKEFYPSPRKVMLNSEPNPVPGKTELQGNVKITRGRTPGGMEIPPSLARSFDDKVVCVWEKDGQGEIHAYTMFFIPQKSGYPMLSLLCHDRLYRFLPQGLEVFQSRTRDPDDLGEFVKIPGYPSENSQTDPPNQITATTLVNGGFLIVREKAKQGEIPSRFVNIQQTLIPFNRGTRTITGD
jgi:hypothetical protein